MKEYAFLNDNNKAGTLTLVLALCAVASVISACMVMGGMHSVLSTVLLGTGALISIALACFIIHYLNYNNAQGQSVKAPSAALHAWAVHGILMVSALLVGKLNTFSFGVTHALTDGCLAALLALLCYCFANRKPGFWLPVIAAVAVAVLSLLEIHIAVELLLTLLAVIAVIIAIRGFKTRAGLAVFTIITSLAVIVIALLAVFKAQNASIHMILHVAVQLVMLLVACAARVIVKAGSLYATGDQSLDVGKSCESKDQKADATEESAANNDSREDIATEEAQNEHFTKSWVNKRVESLSPSELLLAPVDSLYGVSAGDAKLLKEAFGIKTIGDFADNKFFAWAQKIVAKSKK